MDKVEKFMSEMEDYNDGGWDYESAKSYIGHSSLRGAIKRRKSELDEFNRGIEAASSSGFDLSFLLRKKK